MATPPLSELLDGKLKTYAEEAFGEYSRGRMRGCYDLLMLAFNTTLAELKAEGPTLFARLDGMVERKQLEPEVTEYARSLGFLQKHDRGVSDMDLSYLQERDVSELVSFLERYFRSLKQCGGQLTGTPPSETDE